MLSRDHYAVLGIPPDADQDAIEAAYRRLSRRYHPGLNPGNARSRAAFERIRRAYDVLTDEHERRLYDRDGRSTVDRIEMAASADQAAQEASFGELFRRLCDHARRTRPLRGGDVHATVICRLADAERGRRTTVQMRRLSACEHCGGRGAVGMRATTACSTCGGSGKEVFARGTLSVAVGCSDCFGEGVHSGLPCPACHAVGLTNVTETIAVQIPPGVLDGQELRIRGAGHQGRRGGPPGDLVLTVRLSEEPGFERHGPHLLRQVEITVSEAVLGARIAVPTLDGGSATLRVPPGARAGQRLKLRGHGLEMPNGLRGDLVVELQLWLPELVDEDAKRLIREFGERTDKPARPDNERATVQR